MLASELIARLQAVSTGRPEIRVCVDTLDGVETITDLRVEGEMYLSQLSEGRDESVLLFTKESTASATQNGFHNMALALMDDDVPAIALRTWLEAAISDHEAIMASLPDGTTREALKQ